MTFMGFAKDFSGMMAARWYAILTLSVNYIDTD